MGEGAAHVVLPIAPRLHKGLELGHDLLPAAVAGVVHPVAVVNFLAPVQAQNHVVALPVGKFHDLFIQEDAVGGEGEAEVLVVDGLQAPGVAHQLLDHIKVHQRFAAEEVHLQVLPGAGVLNEEVQRPLAHLQGHNRPLAVVLALARKAVGAV